MNIRRLKSLSIILIGASLTACNANFARAQNVTLPPGPTFSGPIAYAQPLWWCCKNNPPFPSITNGVDANNYLLPNVSATTLPFVNSASAPVAVVWTSAQTQYVRVWGNGSREAGAWVAPANQIRGLTPDQIKDVLSLPGTPTNQSIVKLPAQTCMLVGKAGPISGWGNGGATQVYLLGRSPNGCGPGSGPNGDGPEYVSANDFFNGQPLGLYALSYVPKAGRGNPGAVAFALDHAIFPEQFTDMDGVYSALDVINFGHPGPLRYALTQLDGEVNANISSVMIGAGRMFLEVLQDQTHLARLPSVRRLANGWRPWISGLGGAGYLYGSENYKGFNFSGGGVSFGADYLYSPEIQFGVSGAYTRSAFATNGVSGSGSVDSYSFGSYAGYSIKNIYVDAAVGYAYNNANVGRSISFPGVTRFATANPNNDALLSRAELGYRLPLTEKLKISPLAAFQGIVVFGRNFQENGAGAISLNVTERTLATAVSIVGGEVSYSFPIGLDAPLTLSSRAGWSHDFADVSRKVQQNFQGLLRSDFWAEGAAWPRNAASIGAKLVLPVARADLFLRYDGLFANNAELSSATGGLTVKF